MGAPRDRRLAIVALHLGYLGYLSLAAPAFAGPFAGTGFSGATYGRVVPGLHAGFTSTYVGMSAAMAGTRTNIYSYSSYALSGFYLWRPGKLIWGEVVAGIGLGTYAARSRYRDAPIGSASSHWDFTAGPAMRVMWNFAGPAYMGVEGLYGMRSPLLALFLVSQDVVTFSAGVHF